MPKGILSRLIVAMHKFIEAQTLVWRTGVVLKDKSTRAEIIEYYNKKEIHIRIFGNRKRDLMVNINYELQKIHDTFNRNNKNLKFNIHVPCICPQCLGNPDPHFFTLENLQNRRASKETDAHSVQCEISYKQISVFQLTDDFPFSQYQKKESEVDNRPKHNYLNEKIQPLERQNMIFNSIRDKAFVCYSNQDQKFLLEFQKAFKPHIRAENFDVWSDTRIKAGALWQEEIKKALGAAKVAVLLVSINFLSSDFIHDVEFPTILGAAENEGLTILWIPVSASGYKKTKIKDYQATHPPSEPLDSLEESSH
jgi:internalin A